MRRFGLYNAVKQGKMTSEPGASNETIVTEAAPPEKNEVAPVQQPRKKYSAYRTILSPFRTSRAAANKFLKAFGACRHSVRQFFHVQHSRSLRGKALAKAFPSFFNVYFIKFGRSLSV